MNDSECGGNRGPDAQQSHEIVLEMYALANALAGSDVQYYASHGRKLGARLHHMILSQDPASDIGFFNDTYR